MIFNREPALILAAVQAIVLLAVAFGLDLTTEQLAAVGTVAAAIASVIVRAKVTPVDKP